MELKDFQVGDRVQLAPHTDLWMRGMRYGEVIKVGSSYLTILGDNGRSYGLQPSMIYEIVKRGDTCAT